MKNKFLFLLPLFCLLVVTSVSALETSVSLNYVLSDFTNKYNFTQNVVNSNTGIFINEDGTRFYHADTSKNYIYQYDLNKPYDLSTYTINKSKSISLTYGTIWLTSNEKILIIARTPNVVEIYNNSDLDVSTMTFIESYSISRANYGVAFSPDGLNLFVADNYNNRLEQYVLTQSYNLTTATLKETFSTTTVGLNYRCSNFQGIQILNGGKGFLIGCGAGIPSIKGYVIFNATSPYNISSITNNVGVDFELEQVGKAYFANNKNLYIVEESSPAIRKVMYYTTNFENSPPNNATDIKPSNTTITLNSTGVSFHINWTGGDDDDGDIVTSQVYLNLFGSKKFLGNTTTKNLNVVLNNTLPTNSFYTIWLNLSDNKNYTISEGNYFRLCVNDWKETQTECVDNLQTTVYKDLNNCPETYDIPINNGTINACGLKESETINIQLEQNTENLILIFILITLFLITILKGGLTSHLLTSLYIVTISIYFFITHENILILVGGGFLSMVITFLGIKNFNK